MALAAVSLWAQGGPPGATINDFHVVDGVTRWIYVATDSGVYRSRDDGSTWQAFNDGLPWTEFETTAVTGVTNQLFVSLDGDGVYRWQNEGPWVKTSNGITDLEVFSLAAKPGDPTFVLAGTYSKGVFRSTDGGDSWTRLTGLPVVGSFTDIAFAPNDTQRILALSNPAQLYESRDGGGSWTPRAGSQSVTLRGVTFDPSNPDRAYVASSIGIFRQDGPGQNLAGLPATERYDFTDVAVDPSNSNVLYLADRYGVLVSTDQGGTYTRAAGLPQAGGFSLEALPGETTRVLAGAYGSGVFVSDDMGATYQPSSIGLNGANVFSIAVDPNMPGVAYASTDGGEVYKTVNNGDSRREARGGLAQFRSRALMVDPADSNRVYSGSINR
ncbi:MAG: hypothetical protein KDC27_03130, partial [Acidobacteria bacterium]|nr:hypothetical protein [Acidobacteriota bacterium]